MPEASFSGCESVAGVEFGVGYDSLSPFLDAMKRGIVWYWCFGMENVIIRGRKWWGMVERAKVAKFWAKIPPKLGCESEKWRWSCICVDK